MQLVAPLESLIIVAEVSQPNQIAKEDGHQQWDKPGCPRVKEYKEAVLTNWKSPLLWHHINTVAIQCGPLMHPTEIVNMLKKLDPILFAHLAPQTLGSWIDWEGAALCWSDWTLKLVCLANKPGGVTTCVGVLVKYPEVFEKILKTMEDLRATHVPLTLVTIQGIMIAQLHYNVPQIFKTPSPDETLFCCSEAFVKKFIDHALGWSMWHSTRAGGKIPENAAEILMKSFLWMAYSIKDGSIPSQLMANSNQTQLTLAHVEGVVDLLANFPVPGNFVQDILSHTGSIALPNTITFSFLPSACYVSNLHFISFSLVNHASATRQRHHDGWHAKLVSHACFGTSSALVPVTAQYSRGKW